MSRVEGEERGGSDDGWFGTTTETFCSKDGFGTIAFF